MLALGLSSLGNRKDSALLWAAYRVAKRKIVPAAAGKGNVYCGVLSASLLSNDRYSSPRSNVFLSLSR